MSHIEERMAMIFNEWAKRYSEAPDAFGEILDCDGKPIEDYGQRCTAYFTNIANEMDAAGVLPVAPPAVAHGSRSISKAYETSLPKVPSTDEEVLEALTRSDPLRTEILRSLYLLKRLQGMEFGDAYEYTLRVAIGENS